MEEGLTRIMRGLRQLTAAKRLVQQSQNEHNEFFGLSTDVSEKRVTGGLKDAVNAWGAVMSCYSCDLDANSNGEDPRTRKSKRALAESIVEVLTRALTRQASYEEVRATLDEEESPTLTLTLTLSLSLSLTLTLSIIVQPLTKRKP